MTTELGDWGEDRAALHLAEQGLRVIERRYRTRWGEVDLICRQEDTWVFVEVKTRTHASQPSAADAITPGKIHKLTKAALSYMKHKRRTGDNLRFDVVLIEAGRVEWIPNAFEPSSFYTL